MMPLKAGPMRRRVQLVPVQNSAQPNAYGEMPAVTLAPIAVWASVEPLSGRELWQAQQVQADVSHRVRLRWSSLVSAAAPKWRVLYGNRSLNVEVVRNVEERNRVLELLCKEEV